MNKILTKKQLSDHAYSFVVENGQIARSSRPGNFVTVRADIHSERIPSSSSIATSRRGR